MRLVVLNAVDAAERGAVIRTRTRCVRAERGDAWRLILNARGVREVATARVLINAAGAWADTVAEMVLRQKPSGRLRLDKGSHIVVRRLYDHDRAYSLQAPDGRVVFTIPFQRDFTLVGTTDQGFSGLGLGRIEDGKASAAHARRARLQRLCAPDLAAVFRHRRVVRHVLRLERPHLKTTAKASASAPRRTSPVRWSEV